jgi:anti-sigma factor RsiW
MHPEDGALQTLLDGELDTVAAGAARAHLTGCAECRSRLDALRADDVLVGESLAALDRALPMIPAVTVIARARRARSSLRWAAAIALFLFGAGALYAIPGSPLRHWIATLVRQARPQQGPVGPSAGIALEPGPRFQIVFASQTASRVTIALTDEKTIAARHVDGAGTARFTAGIDGLQIDPGTAPGDFAVDIPRAAPWVEVLVGSRRIFLKDGPQIMTDTKPDSLGHYVLPLATR